MKIIATLDDIKEVAFIAIPKKNNTGYLRSPISHFNNDLYLFINDLNFFVDDHYKYHFTVRRHSGLFNNESINYLLNELSKKYNKDYELVSWNAFWDFIDDLNSK